MKKKNDLKKIYKLFYTFIFAFFVSCLGNNKVFADSRFSVSPMNQKIILTPGETYHGSFSVINPANSVGNFNFEAEAGPFYVDEDYAITYENNGDMNQIVDWITIDSPKGTIEPNTTKEINFHIKVPMDVPAGGQYATITVSSDNASDSEGDITIQSKFAIAHIIYAEIAGTTVRKGEMVSADVPGFLFSGNISGNSTFWNTGNVHSTATYKLQVFPVFSNEEIYTNEEKPETKTILPNRSFYNSTTWSETPHIGIFNVIYTAEFEGVTTEVKKIVVVCPLWLLSIVVFGILLVIIWLVSRSKARAKK